MSERGPQLGKGEIVANGSAKNNHQVPPRSPMPTTPKIFLNNLKLSSKSSIASGKTSCNSINTLSTTTSTTNHNNNVTISGVDENSHSAPAGQTVLTIGDDGCGEGGSVSKSHNNLYRPVSKLSRLSRDVEIDIDDNEDGESDDGGIDPSYDLNDSSEQNNFIFRIGPGSGTSDQLRVPGGIFLTGRGLMSNDNFLEGEMSEEKLLKALEDDEARDYVPSPSNRWRKTSESNGLNRSPRAPLRNSKSSSALLNGNKTPMIGVTTQNSLWMSHDCGDDYLKHECDEKCSSALHMAVKTGNLDEVEIQLETNADPNARDCYGRTPLHYAVTMGMTH